MACLLSPSLSLCLLSSIESVCHSTISCIVRMAVIIIIIASSAAAAFLHASLAVCSTKCPKAFRGFSTFLWPTETTPSMLFLLLPPPSPSLSLLLLSFSLLLLSTSHRALHISAVASPCLSLSLSQCLAFLPLTFTLGICHQQSPVVGARC